MNLAHIKSEPDVDEFLSGSLPDYYQFHLEQRGHSEDFVALIVESAWLNDLLRKKICKSFKWAKLVVFDCDESGRQCAGAYPRELRLHFCPVKIRCWPHPKFKARNAVRKDCSSLLANVATIHSGQDLHFLYFLFLHNWYMRDNARQPFFWYQDVSFADENLLLAFCEKLAGQEAFTGCVFMAAFDKTVNLHVRFLFLPWKFCFPHVETGGSEFYDGNRLVPKQAV